MENRYFLSLKKFLLSLSDLHKVNRENYVSFFSFTGLIKLVDTFISVLVLILLLWQFRLLEKTNTNFRFEITKNSITRLKVVSRIEIDLNQSVFLSFKSRNAGFLWFQTRKTWFQVWEPPNKPKLGVPTRLNLEKFKKCVKNDENDQFRQTRWSTLLSSTFEEIVSQAT